MARDPAEREAAGLDPSLLLGNLVGILKRHILGLVIANAIALLLVYVGLTLVKPTYKSSTEILLVDPKAHIGTGDRGISTFDIDNTAINSEIELLHSRSIAALVVKKLGLAADPEFVGGGKAASDQLESPEDIAAAALAKRTDVERVPFSYALTLSVASKDPVKAALIANEVASAYIEDQLDAKALTAERARSWMQKRIDELKEQSGIAVQRLQQFDANVKATSEGQLNKDQQDERAQLVQRTESLRTAYETLVNLGRYSQSIEDRSLPLTDARVVTLASAPFEASSPSILWTFFIALVIGGMVGCAAAWAYPDAV